MLIIILLFCLCYQSFASIPILKQGLIGESIMALTISTLVALMVTVACFAHNGVVIGARDKDDYTLKWDKTAGISGIVAFMFGIEALVCIQITKCLSS